MEQQQPPTHAKINCQTLQEGKIEQAGPPDSHQNLQEAEGWMAHIQDVRDSSMQTQPDIHCTPTSSQELSTFNRAGHEQRQVKSRKQSPMVGNRSQLHHNSTSTESMRIKPSLNQSHTTSIQHTNQWATKTSLPQRKSPVQSIIKQIKQVKTNTG